jgi:hypothetical protein
VDLLDLSNPAKPVLLGSCTPLFQPSDIKLVGNIAYIASYEQDFLSTVEIVDFSSPTNAVLRGYYDTDGYAQEVIVVGNTLYVADDVGGMVVVDVSNPARPTRIGGYDTQGHVQHIQVVGRYAYITDAGWLVILDINDPTFPIRVGLYEVAGGIQLLRVNGQTAYVADTTGQLLALDVSDPGNIGPLGTYNTWGTQSLAVAGKYAYLAMGSHGLEMVDVSKLTNIVWVTDATIGGVAQDVAVMGKYILVAAGDAGLKILQLQQSIYPPLEPPVCSGRMMTLTWPAMDGVRLQKCTNLVNAVWEDVPESEGTNTLTLPMTEGKAFFRLVKGPKLTSGMVAWWPGDGDARDLIGTNNAIVVNGTTFAEGMVGRAFAFDGIDDFVSVPNSPVINFHDNTPMTLMLWAYRTGDNSPVHLIGKRPGCDTPVQYQMAYDSDKGVGFGGGDNGAGIFRTGVHPPLNEWMHYAATFDGTTIGIYLNGACVDKGNGFLGAESDAPLEIGKAGDCQVFPGMIDEVMLFNRALSDDEIKAIYDAGSARLPKPR